MTIRYEVDVDEQYRRERKELRGNGERPSSIPQPPMGKQYEDLPSLHFPIWLIAIILSAIALGVYFMCPVCREEIKKNYTSRTTILGEFNGTRLL